VHFLYFFLLLLLATTWSIILFLGDYRTSDEVRVREFCLFEWYKEFSRSFLGYFLHIFLSEFVIGLELLLVFVSTCNDVNLVPIPE
jgi:F0F1-type ATP synthase membrane subunit a